MINVGFDGPPGALVETVANIVWSTYVTREKKVCLIKPLKTVPGRFQDGLAHLLALLSEARLHRLCAPKPLDVEIVIHSPFSLSRIAAMAAAYGQSSIVTKSLISKVVDCPRADILFSCQCSSDAAVRRAVEPEEFVRKMCCEHACMSDPETDVSSDWMTKRLVVLDTEGGPKEAAEKAGGIIDRQLKGGTDDGTE